MGFKIDFYRLCGRKITKCRMIRINRFAPLYIPQEPTDYEDFEDVPPYNKLENGKWRSLWLNRHPLYYIITNRFNGEYDGKLMWRELNIMKEQIEKKRKSLIDYQNRFASRREELIELIREQKKLCGQGIQAHTVMNSSISASDTNITGPLAVHKVMKETCAQKLQKHLDECTGKYKCTLNYVCYDCQFKENGRCGHYYDIERANEELENFEYYEDEDESLIMDLEIQYERALAVKENRLDEYKYQLEYDYEEWNFEVSQRIM